MIHKLSDVHPSARIGDQVKVGPFTSIAADVEIGEGTIIGPNVTIMDGARIGANCNIYPGAVISAVPQDLKFDGEHTTVEIGDRTYYSRMCYHQPRHQSLRAKPTLGKDCLIMAYVHIAHDCIIGNKVILVNSVALAGHVEVGDWSIISGLSAVHQFVKIADHVMVGGGAMVRKDVPPFITAAGDPLTYAGVNSVGLRRREFNNEQIREIQDIYRIIYQSGKNISQAVETVKIQFKSSQLASEIIDFIQSSERGLIRK
jgi:UDP-N-acetylglucosamine acyltransferase